jgi:hypothetical protein
MIDETSNEHRCVAWPTKDSVYCDHDINEVAIPTCLLSSGLYVLPLLDEEHNLVLIG